MRYQPGAPRNFFRACDPPASRTTNRSPPVFPRSASPIAQPQFTRPAKGSPRMPGMTAADVIHHHGKVYTHEGFCTSDPTAAPLISARLAAGRASPSTRSTGSTSGGGSAGVTPATSLLAPVQSSRARAVAEAAPVSRRRAGPTAAPSSSTRPPARRAAARARAPCGRPARRSSERRRARPFSTRRERAHNSFRWQPAPLVRSASSCSAPIATSFSRIASRIFFFRSDRSPEVVVSPVLKWSACIMALYSRERLISPPRRRATSERRPGDPEATAPAAPPPATAEPSRLRLAG